MSQRSYQHLEIRADRGVSVLTVTERALHDAETSAALLRELIAAVDEAGARQVVLDLGNVKSVSGPGIEALVAFRRFLRQRDGFMLLCRVDGPVAEALFATQQAGSTSTSKIPFGLAPDVSTAVAYLTGAGWGSYQLHPVQVGRGS